MLHNGPVTPYVNVDGNKYILLDFPLEVKQCCILCPALLTNRKLSAKKETLGDKMAFSGCQRLLQLLVLLFILLIADSLSQK